MHAIFARFRRLAYWEFSRETLASPGGAHTRSSRAFDMRALAARDGQGTAPCSNSPEVARTCRERHVRLLRNCARSQRPARPGLGGFFGIDGDGLRSSVMRALGASVCVQTSRRRALWPRRAQPCGLRNRAGGVTARSSARAKRASGAFVRAQDCLSTARPRPDPAAGEGTHGKQERACYTARIERGRMTKGTQ